MTHMLLLDTATAGAIQMASSGDVHRAFTLPVIFFLYVRDDVLQSFQRSPSLTMHKIKFPINCNIQCPSMNCIGLTAFNTETAFPARAAGMGDIMYILRPEPISSTH